jgi:hypothetical protein
MKLLIPLLLLCGACQKKYTPPEIYSKLVGEWISIDANRPSTVVFRENLPRVSFSDRFNRQNHKIYSQRIKLPFQLSLSLTKNKTTDIICIFNAIYDTAKIYGSNNYSDFDLKKVNISYVQLFVKK